MFYAETVIVSNVIIFNNQSPDEYYKQNLDVTLLAATFQRELLFRKFENLPLTIWINININKPKIFKI